MQKTKDEIASSIRHGFSAISMLVLSVITFMVFLWAVMAVVRMIMAIGG